MNNTALFQYYYSQGKPGTASWGARHPVAEPAGKYPFLANESCHSRRALRGLLAGSKPAAKFSPAQYPQPPAVGTPRPWVS